MKSNEICPEKSWNSNSFCFTFLKWYQDWAELYSEGSYRGTTEPDSWAQTQMNKTTDWLIKKIYVVGFMKLQSKHWRRAWTTPDLFKCSIFTIVHLLCWIIQFPERSAVWQNPQRPVSSLFCKLNALFLQNKTAVLINDGNSSSFIISFLSSASLNAPRDVFVRHVNFELIS